MRIMHQPIRSLILVHISTNEVFSQINSFFGEEMSWERLLESVKPFHVSLNVLSIQRDSEVLSYNYS